MLFRCHQKHFDSIVVRTLVLIRFRLSTLLKASSTLMRFRLKTHTFRCVLAFRPHWFPKRFHEKHRFENALESGSKRKRTYIVLMWTVESASKWKRWPKISRERAFAASLRSKRFQSSYCAKVKSGSKKKVEGGGGEEKRKRLPANPTILENAPWYFTIRLIFKLAARQV